MERASKRGKIPQSDWPLIMARYEAGETLASIARTYDCSPPAISYIVNRTRSKPTREAPSPGAAEPQLIKSGMNGAGHGAASTELEAVGTLQPVIANHTRTHEESVVAEPLAAATLSATASIHHAPVEGSTPAPAEVLPRPQRTPIAAPPPAEPRPRLHLGFGSGNGHARGSSAPAEAGSAAGPRPQPAPPQPLPPSPSLRGDADRAAPRPFDGPRRSEAMGNGHGHNRDGSGLSEPRPPMPAPREPAPRKDDAIHLDRELRSRVDDDIAAFLAAFDAVLAADTQESRFGLREATDRLLRVGARTRIELERLEARVPLPAREGGRAADPAGWQRYR